MYNFVQRNQISRELLDGLEEGLGGGAERRGCEGVPEGGVKGRRENLWAGKDKIDKGEREEGEQLG